MLDHFCTVVYKQTSPCERSEMFILNRDASMLEFKQTPGTPQEEENHNLLMIKVIGFLWSYSFFGELRSPGA